MSHEIDLSFLDIPEVLEIVFPLAYSNFNFHFAIPQPKTYMDIEDIRIGYGFWIKSKSSPTILYFHGNGETPGDYSEIASFYNQRNINLFVASYRGYGISTGFPTITTLLRDCHLIFQEFKKIIEKREFVKKIFLMGRSLGSIPAIELAYHYQLEFSGIIIESGLANNFRRWHRYLKPRDREFILNEQGEFLNKVKARAIKIPALVIHGECDSIIPCSEGKELYENLASKYKKLLIISGADHNDIMNELYFNAIEEFIAKFK
ncbi:MAG: alpha/beta hydrolase [Methanocellales archaeon]